jgi:hypothetical protein
VLSHTSASSKRHDEEGKEGDEINRREGRYSVSSEYWSNYPNPDTFSFQNARVHTHLPLKPSNHQGIASTCPHLDCLGIPCVELHTPVVVVIVDTAHDFDLIVIALMPASARAIAISISITTAAAAIVAAYLATTNARCPYPTKLSKVSATLLEASDLRFSRSDKVLGLRDQRFLQ